ncbi:MAG: Do family serine endopeptidase [Granulosicoccaceae bacterium]
MQRIVTGLLVLFLGVLSPTLHATLPFSDGEKELPSLAPMLKRATPAVVNIATKGAKTIQNPLAQDPFFRRFFEIPRQTQRRTQSLGSGVIVDADQGLILTNQHVIKYAHQITVTLSDGREASAKLIGADEKADLAVIKIDTPNLTAVQWFDSEQLEVGDFVVAIGNPFGLGQTVTSGIVSALGRSGLGIEEFEDFIQTDASINPGNSGGALVNLRGELVGINTAIIGPAGGNVGIGFAIPANLAQQLMTQLVKYGEVRRGRLGIALQNLTAELADALGVQTRRGAIIARVLRGSPAETAGLEPGDVVLEMDGRKVRDAKTLINLIGLKPVGTEVRLTIARGEETVDIDVEIR